MVKSFFSDEKKFNLDGLDGLQKYCNAKKFPEEKYSKRHSGEGSFMIWVGPSHLQKNLNDNLSVVDEKQIIMWICYIISLSHKKSIVYVEKNGFFLQDNAAIHNESQIKKYSHD